MNLRLFNISLACALAAAPAVMAQSVKYDDVSLTAQPSRWTLHGEPYVVRGYGKALFGMSVEQVRAVLAAEFPAALPGLVQTESALERTQALTITPDALALAPGPVPASVSYVFGAASRSLIAVRLVWRVDGVATQAQQDQLSAAGGAACAALLGYRWPMLSTARGVVPAPATLILFTGRDAAGAAVEVRLDGVGFDVEKPKDAQGRQPPAEHRAAPAGPAQLSVSYVADNARPDVYRIPENAF